MISLAVFKTGVYKKYHVNRDKYQEPVCRAVWTIPFKAVPVHPLIVAMRLVETLVSSRLDSWPPSSALPRCPMHLATSSARLLGVFRRPSVP